MTRAPHEAARDQRFDVDALLADRDTSIVICCGAGGVGKTTMSAALAVRAAEAGRRVAVLTIDPARRLAQSLGIEELDNTPRQVVGIDTTAGGSLDAMMLDMKRTFDDVVISQATPDKAEQILRNPFYEALSRSFSGTQEYMAMEKLGQLHAEARASDRWDLIIVDTPPARSALDFLDAPEHLANLLDGRFLRLLLTSSRGGGLFTAPLRLMSAGVNLVLSAMNKVLGGQILRDVQTFAAAFETLFGGFRQRAERTLALLSSPTTTFLVVAAPERDALREAAFFVDRLREERMPLAAVLVNRVHGTELAEVSAERALSLAEAEPAGAVEDVALRLHAARMRTIEREQLLLHRFAQPRPSLAIHQIDALPRDVTDVTALRQIGALLT